MKSLIKVENLTKKFGQETVLNHVTVNFNEGLIHGVIGKNGSGKTMLFKAICGFIKPTSGRITVREKIIGQDNDFPKDLGLIIETPGFLPYYSGVKNLLLLAQLNGKIDREEVVKTMVRVGLDPKSKKHVRKYSMGMNQRLGIAQAIMENPTLLILDEPMNGLDKQGIADVRKLFLRLRDEGKTILISSHNSEDIELLCDTVHEMDRGEITLLKSAEN